MALSKTSWQKGYCANPGGRPRHHAEIRDKAFTLSLKGLAFLERVINDENEPTKNRLAALSIAFDRALGRPTQAIQIEEPPNLYNIPAKELTKPQLEMLLSGKIDELFSSCLETKTSEELALLLESHSEKVLGAMQQSDVLKPLLKNLAGGQRNT